MNRTIEPYFECGQPTKGRHHVVPVVAGGTESIPLCHDCHCLVHGYVSFGSCIKEGLRKARERGIKLGTPKKLTKNVISNIKNLRKSGLTYKQISNEVGLSVGSVHSALNPTC